VFVTVISIGLGFAISASPTSAAEKEYPNREINIIINTAPGGFSDLSCRVVAQELQKVMGVPIVIDNKAGAGGVIGINYLKTVKPDGYTLLVSSNAPFTLQPYLTPSVGFQWTDFVPIFAYAKSPNVIGVRTESPFKTLKDLIEYAKKNPGKLSAGTSGVGSAGHIVLELLKIAEKLEIKNVPFKGGAPSLTALLGGHTDIDINAFTTIRTMLQAGKIRPLASTFGRVDEFKISSLGDLGYPQAELGLLGGVYGPKGIPQPVMNKIVAGYMKVVQNPEVIDKLQKIGSYPISWGPDEFAKAIGDEAKKLSDLVKKAKLSED
jgi:tripartite-type tricarboxylate transporter receptor subunit TctC